MSCQACQGWICSASASASHLIDLDTTFLSSPLITASFLHLPTLIPNDMSDDLWSSFLSETANADLPSFAPPPLESFEEVLKALEHESLDVGAQYPTLLDISPPYRDASTLYLAPSFASTYSTPGLTEDISNTEYSFITDSTSTYPPLFDLTPSDIVFGSEDNYVDPKHNPVISDPSMFPEESGTSQSSFQRDHVVNSQLDDDGPDQQVVGISPHCLSAASQGPPPPPVVPIDPPADAASATRVFTGPIRKKPTYYQCDQCGRGEYNVFHFYFRDTQRFLLVIKQRKSNFTGHMKTHDLNRERPSVCRESGCNYRTDRSHDLKRHQEDIHGVLAE
jgi:hypothetical protein